MNKQHKILLICLIGISFIYYISSCYINTSNDGSHFALVSSIVEKHTTSISDFIKYTGFTDYAEKNGKYYSDRLPGTAFLLIPFYLFGSLLDELNSLAFTNHVPIQEVTVILMSNICAVLGVYYLFLILLHFKFSFQISLINSLLYAFSTLNWQESTHVFSHAASMYFVLAAFYYLLKAESIQHRNYFIFVCLLSYSIVLELQNCLLFIPAALYILQTNKITGGIFQSKNLAYVFKTILIISGFLSILILYNYISFGEIMLKSNKYNPEFPEEISFSSSLSGNLLEGLDRLFLNSQNPEVITHLELGVKNDIPGLLMTSPILIISLFGFIYFIKSYPKEMLMFCGIICINVLIAALHKTVLVRHIFTITPFLFLPFAFVLKEILVSQKNNLKLLLLSIIGIASAISIFRVYYVTHTYWGREITNPFPFLKELPIYFIFLITLSVLWFIFKAAFNKQIKRF